MKGQELVADTVPLTQNNSFYQLKVVIKKSSIKALRKRALESDEKFNEIAETKISSERSRK
jgi:hypothetical protein